MYWIWNKSYQKEPKNVLIMIDNNLILYLPFDDPDGNTAYDFSKNRADAALTLGACFTTDAKIVKALSLNRGEATTSVVLPFGSDFTMSFYAMTDKRKMGWMLNYNALNTYQEQWLDVSPGKYAFFVFVKSGSVFKVYKDNELVYNQTLLGTPVGFSFNDEDLEESNAFIDDLRIFNVAKSVTEILELSAETDVEYYVNGVNFKDYGVYVSKHSGLIGGLAQKDSLTVNWEDYHGRVRDKKNKRFKERTITLDCFIEAQSRSAYVRAVMAFLAQWQKDGTQRLKVEYDGKAKPLVYEVDLTDEINPSETWGRYNDELMVGTFQLKLVEDEPVKRVLRHISATANSVSSITLTTVKMVNIYWGDGNMTSNVSGTNTTVTHTYTDAGEYDIIITGVIEKITAMTTNDIVIWDNLR